jgi:hypothetical protein
MGTIPEVKVRDEGPSLRKLLKNDDHIFLRNAHFGKLYLAAHF